MSQNLEPSFSTVLGAIQITDFKAWFALKCKMNNNESIF